MNEVRLNSKMVRDEADDALDAVLDQALSSYASSVPRDGFEARILARIDAEGEVGERRKWNVGWRLPVFSGVALVAFALTLVFILQPGKKQIELAKQPIMPQNLPASTHESAPVRDVFRPKSDALPQSATRNAEDEQDRLIRKLMANAPEAIASLVRIDDEQRAESEQKEPAAAIKIIPIQFEPIHIEPIDSNDNQPATEPNSSDAASQ